MLLEGGGEDVEVRTEESFIFRYLEICGNVLIICVLLPNWMMYIQGVDGGDEDEEGEEEGEGEKLEEEGKEKEEEEEEEEGMFCLPLESLGLGGNKIGDIGAQHLASALASNTSQSRDLPFDVM